MILYRLTLLATVALLTACGGDAPEQGGGSILAEPAETRQVTMTYDTHEGPQAYGYTVELPPAYASAKSGPEHRWQVKGTRGSIAPHVRIWMARQPSTLDAVAERAANPSTGLREIVVKEETEHAFIVVARDIEGDWTQVEAWCKGVGVAAHCMIELYKVERDSPQIKWALGVARSLRSTPPVGGD